MHFFRHTLFFIAWIFRFHIQINILMRLFLCEGRNFYTFSLNKIRYLQARASVVKAPVTKTKQTCVRICSYLKVFRKLHICYLNEYIVVFNLCFCWQTTPPTTYETFPRCTRISDTEVRWKTAANTLYLNIIIFHLATACFYFRWGLSCLLTWNRLYNF